MRTLRYALAWLLGSFVLGVLSLAERVRPKAATATPDAFAPLVTTDYARRLSPAEDVAFQAGLRALTAFGWRDDGARA